MNLATNFSVDQAGRFNGFADFQLASAFLLVITLQVIKTVVGRTDANDNIPSPINLTDEPPARHK